MRAVVALALKDLVLLGRDRMALFWTIAFPLLFAGFLSAVLRSTVVPTRPAFSVVVVDDTSDAQGRLWIEALGRVPGVSAVAADAPIAERSVRRGEHLALVTLPPGHRAGIVDSPTVRVAVDPSRQSELPLVLATVEQSAAALAGIVPAPARTAAVALDGDAPAPTSWSLVLPIALMWGLMGCSATFAIAMVAERARGTLLRLQAAPIGPGQLVISKALSSFTACVLVSALLVGAACGWLGVTILHPERLVLVAVCASICFVGITLLLGAMGKSEQAVAGSGWGALVLMAMLGGAMVPPAFVPPWLRSLGEVSPARWAIRGFEGAIWRGLPFDEMFAPCTLLLAVGIGCLSLGARRMRRA